MKRKHKAIANRKRQGGSALLISLLLLVAIAIIGLSSLSGTATNEIIASNMQQKSIGFQAAESAIRSIEDWPTLANNLPATPLNNPPAVSFARGTEYDQPKVDVDASVTFQYCGEQMPIGASLSASEGVGETRFMDQVFDIRGMASINNSNVNSDHLVRVRKQHFETNRTGNCPVI